MNLSILSCYRSALVCVIDVLRNMMSCKIHKNINNNNDNDIKEEEEEVSISYYYSSKI